MNIRSDERYYETKYSNEFSFMQIMILKFLSIQLFVLLIVNTNSIIVDDESNAEFVMPENTPICLFSRRRTALDDVNMPPVLTFCSCAILGPKMVITAKSCFIQLNWYIYIVRDNSTEDAIEKLLTQNLYKILHVYDSARISIAFTENIISSKYGTIAYRVKKSPSVSQCFLVSFLTPLNRPVKEKNETLILYKIWKVSKQLVKIPVEVVDYEDSTCYWKHSIEQPPLKTGVEPGTLLCVQPKSIVFDTCAPDLGAPIFCDNVLMGLLSTMINRPPDGIQDLNTEIPLHVPNSCYTTINASSTQQYSYIAENLRNEKIDAFISKVSSHRKALYDNEDISAASTLFTRKYYFIMQIGLFIFLIIYSY